MPIQHRTLCALTIGAPIFVLFLFSALYMIGYIVERTTDAIDPLESFRPLAPKDGDTRHRLANSASKLQAMLDARLSLNDELYVSTRTDGWDEWTLLEFWKMEAYEAEFKNAQRECSTELESWKKRWEDFDKRMSARFTALHTRLDAATEHTPSFLRTYVLEPLRYTPWLPYHGPHDAMLDFFICELAALLVEDMLNLQDVARFGSLENACLQMYKALGHMRQMSEIVMNSTGTAEWLVIITPILGLSTNDTLLHLGHTKRSTLMTMLQASIIEHQKELTEGLQLVYDLRKALRMGCKKVHGFQLGRQCPMALKCADLSDVVPTGKTQSPAIILKYLELWIAQVFQRY